MPGASCWDSPIARSSEPLLAVGSRRARPTFLLATPLTLAQRRLWAYMRPMHRPTRKHRNLVAKTERKIARSRRTGAKAKRWKKQLEQYQPLVQDGGEASASS